MHFVRKDKRTEYLQKFTSPPSYSLCSYSGPVTTTSSFCSWPDEMADTFLSTEAPLARRFVEDEAREWRELDYTLEVRFEDVSTII